MFQPSVSVSEQTNPYQSYRSDYMVAHSDALLDATERIICKKQPPANWLVQRWRRERRRRKVGRAYDMALEISRTLPRASPGLRVLDVGCGNGYIAHHLSAMLNTNVIGIDLNEATEAPIDYRRFDGMRFPVESQSLDAVLFNYVLHHAQNLDGLMNEVRRVLRDGGRVSVYEDMPDTWWDRIVCGIHDRTWRSRTGPCTFKSESGWRRLFESAGLEVVNTRSLSRWRNLAHPVSRRLFVMGLHNSGCNEAEQ